MNKMSGTSVITWLDNRLYPGFGQNWDDEFFREFILSKLNDRMIVLDLGAGAGIVKEMNFKSYASKVCGVDPDQRVEENPFLHEGKIGVGESIPYAADTFDLVFSDNVLEHLPNPKSVFVEIARVLKPGGVFVAKTPNKWHYVATIARVTPLWFHKRVVRWRGRVEDDVFPTRYLANTSLAIRRLAKVSGLVVNSIRYVDGRPEYLRFSSITYLMGWVYERIVSRLHWLKGFRVLLVIELFKPD